MDTPQNPSSANEIDSYGFHPVICEWFRSRFDAPTDPQRAGWPSIAAGENTLIAAPTGSGKTLTAFLACIDRLLKDGLSGRLEDGVRVVYVSPLRALSNDMQRNLEQPLHEICELAADVQLGCPPIRARLRTGDTSSSQRAAIVRKPPHILVTTPESLYLMLTGPRSREVLRSVETVIVDEIHALIRDKRGSHLSLTLERLESLAGRPLQRIGLSATQKPIDRVAEFLVGSRPTDDGRSASPKSAAESSSKSSNDEVGVSDGTAELRESHGFDIEDRCNIINVGHGRELDLAVETPSSDLESVCSHEQWAEVNSRVIDLINSHRSTLVFVNTRRMAERVTHQLTELMGEDVVGCHHGSLASELRLRTEQRLKTGKYKAVVATASLELGLDIGYIDLVIQIGSPRSIATFLQRIGRSGHALGLVPKGRLFAMTRDQLMECMALIRAVRMGQLDTIRMPEAPVDVLAQQIVAEVVGREWDTDELYELCRRAMPFRDLTREVFDETVEYLSEGITSTAGRSLVYLHHDQVQKRLRARPGARITATSNGGAIPEIGSYRVVAEPDGTVVGTLDEDFAIESTRGDIFLLGNTSWRLLGLRGSDVMVADAQGAPPSVPFWRGEAPGRTFELSEAVSDLRDELSQRCGNASEAEKWLIDAASIRPEVATQAVAYVAAQKAAVGVVPSQKQVIFERFFDDTGGMQLVVHAPFGGDINRAWGFAMRKRFCRSFDFELQATADDDGFILSLGPQHSFPIDSLFTMLTRNNARGLLEQAVLQVPMFQIRWRWNVTRALLVHRMQNGKKVPPALQRFRADDLLTAVFPKLTGCQEEHTGDHEVPDHPLAQQTMEDCLTEALDLDGLHRVLEKIDAGEITLIARDTREPSPFSYELINSNPYAFLDGGEIQERRARAVQTHRSLTMDSVADLATLNPEAIQQVCNDARPTVRNADELHDVLLTRVILPEHEGTQWSEFYGELVSQRRASRFIREDGISCWVAAERLPTAEAAFGKLDLTPPIECPESCRIETSSIDARMAMIRGLIESSGPIFESQVAARLGITVRQAGSILEALEGEGLVLRGRFTNPEANDDLQGATDGCEPAAESKIDPSISLPSPEAVDSESTGDRIVDAQVHPLGEDTGQTVPAEDREWCHRRLLSRIHRQTVRGLRAQIKPVSVDVYFQFLFRHHGLSGQDQRTGVNGMFEMIGMLQGYDVPAICWERDLLPARLTDYSPNWLDELCLTGEVGWGRLGQRKPQTDSQSVAAMTRVAPMSLWLRQDLGWLRAYRGRTDEPQLSEAAAEVMDLLRDRGAVFARDLLSDLQLLPAQLDDVLGELVTQGLLTADGFAGLRQLIAERPGRSRKGMPRKNGLQRQRTVQTPTGRWSSWAEPSSEEQPASKLDDDTVEQWAWQLLRRWGVVFRDLLDREQAAPRWYELLQVYRRLEARGEIRGGRFISGVAGEQFATGETVTELRKLRESASVDELVAISAADPLNLVGIVTRQSRVASIANSRIAFQSGIPIAARIADRIEWFTDIPLLDRTQIAQLLESDQSRLSDDDAKEDAGTAESPRRKRKTSVRSRSGLPRPTF